MSAILHILIFLKPLLTLHVPKTTTPSSSSTSAQTSQKRPHLRDLD